MDKFNKYDDYKINYEKEFLEEVKGKKKDNVNDKLSLPEMKQKTVRPVRNKKSPKRLDL